MDSSIIFRLPVMIMLGATISFHNLQPERARERSTHAGGSVIAMSMGNKLTSSAMTSPLPAGIGRIAFMSERNGNREIYVMNSDGTGQTRLTNNAAEDRSPHWSPDGKKILFWSARDGNKEIYVMNADGSGQTRLTTNASAESKPDWSPDSTKIVFYSNRDGNDEIYVMRADGSQETRLTFNTSADFSPDWSPDGTKILFWSNRDGNEEVYVMNTDGFGQVNLSNSPSSNDRLPSWSPDGAKIVFTSNRPSSTSHQVWVMNADGTGQTQRATATTDAAYPSWSYDGTKIVYSATAAGNHDVYVMNANGTGQVRLTTTAGFDWEADWRPESVVANDFFSSAQTLAGESGTVTGTNVGATKEPPGEPNHEGNPGGHSVWFAWTAPANPFGVSYVFNTRGSNFNTLLGVYEGNSLDNLSSVAFCSSECGSSASFNPTSGMTYYIAVDGRAGVTGNYKLNWGRALSIGGRVRGLDGSNGSATVTLEDDIGGPPVSDSVIGDYSFNDLPSGHNYSVSVSNTGFAVDGASSYTFLNLQDNAFGWDFVLRFPTFTISGVIHNTNFQGVAGVSVYANGNPCTVGGTTDSSGNYLCTGLVYGDFVSVSISKPGFYVYYYDFGSLTPNARLYGNIFNNFFNDNYFVGVAPGVSITSPANGSTFTALASIIINASTTIGDAPINRVEFYQNGTPLGADTSAPYSFSWPNVAAGSYTLTALVFDDFGVMAESAPVSVTVSARTLTVASSNPASGVAITVSPADNNNQGNGTTQFTRTYNNNREVTLTAPLTAAGKNFQKWQRNGTDVATTVTTTVTMNGNYAMTAVYVAPPIQVTVGTNPAGRSFTVDNTPYTTTQTFNWVSGSSHTIATTTTQSGVTGTQYVFSNWSDAGALSHTVTPTVNTTYTANFTTQHFLTMNAGTGGTVGPASGWFGSGQSVQITATPNSGFSFSGWTGSGSGSYTGANNPTSVTMNGPITQTASFTATGPTTLRIDSVAPKAGRVAGGQQLRLVGAFANLSSVTIGGVSAAWSYTNGTSEVTVTTPAHAVGAVSIVLAPTSGAGYSKTNAFAYLPTVFTDNALVAGVTSAKAQHIIELRQAVDALRAVAGLTPVGWTDPVLVPTSTMIKVVHIQELRSYLEEAAGLLGYPVQLYTDPLLTNVFMIKRAHMEELRQRIRAIAG